jgi:hypothetical protein
MTFFKYCANANCQKKFKPVGVYQEYCNECLTSKRAVNYLKLICHNKGIDLKKLKEFI